ncbi:MAG: hypothetical protein ACPL1Y_04530 [Thermoplasmata archaeon]
MALEKITIEKAKELANAANVKPAKVKGTEILRFAKSASENIELISWEEFEQILAKNKLAVYASGSWMKIMREK